MLLTYPAVFYGNGDEEGYAVVVPDLPGCVSGGYTLEEAMMMGIDAASGWVLGCMEDDRPIPKASHIRDIRPDPEDGEEFFVSMLLLDMDDYAAKFGNDNPVEKSCSIPAWLDKFAEERHVDYSRTLQDSLMDIYVRENSAAYG